MIKKKKKKCGNAIALIHQAQINFVHNFWEINFMK